MSEVAPTKRFYILFPVLFVLVDLGVMVGAYSTAFLIVGQPIVYTTLHANALILSLLVWAAEGLVLKDYKIGRNTSYTTTVSYAIRSVAIFVSVFLFVWVFSNYRILDRTFLGSFFTALLCVTVISRTIIHSLLNWYRSLGKNFRNAIIIGYDKLGFSLYDVLKRKGNHGIRCHGFYGDGEENRWYHKLGTTKDFLNSSWENLDFVYVSENLDKSIIDQIIERADNQFVKVKLLPSYASYQPKTYTLRRFENISIVDVNDLPLDNIFNRFAKRAFDIVFTAFVILFVMSWLYPLIAVGILMESRGPVIFRQLRHGRNNRKFYCYKFRTMIMNSESDTRWATRDDPRVTRFGSFLRKSSLDELPQFFNVLRGEMAIVGPRPHAVEMNEHYKNKVDKFYQRHAHKPGITGLAQAMGYRGEIREFYHIKNRVKLDRFYFQNWSFILDIRIIIKTIVVLLKGQEAAY